VSERLLVTGGAGFIGSNLADRLLAAGKDVVVYDNLRTGLREWVPAAATFVEADLLDADALTSAMAGVDGVFHLAANADVRHGLEAPRRDLEQNTIATSNVLEAMRANGVTKIAFSSTGSVYGEPEVHPTPEDAPFPVQTSLYGASKLAGEGMIAAYCHGYGFTGVVYRFVSILGERYTHGHVIDFYRALKADPTRLRVLGDGRQEKSYLHVGDCIDGMLASWGAVTKPGAFEVFNLGTDETTIVDRSVEMISGHLGAEPEIEKTGGTRGWAGDSPFILLDCAKLRATGWAPTLTIEQAVERTLDWFDAHPEIVLQEPSTV
jgi:UDP-glucose 4-epimerase